MIENSWIDYYGKTKIFDIYISNLILITLISLILILIFYFIFNIRKIKIKTKINKQDIPAPPQISSNSNKTDTRKEKIKIKKQLIKEIKELEKRRNTKSKLKASVQKTIPYEADYDNGIFQINIDKKKDKQTYSIAIQYEDINYSTLSPEDAQNIFLKFADLHNLLPSNSNVFFILENSEEDIERYKESILISSKNDEFKPFREEMNGILESNITEEKKFTKTRTIVISIDSENPYDASQTFKRLETEILQAIKRLGSKGKKLLTLERFEILHDIYRPEHIGKFKDYNLNYQKFKEWNISMKDYICPDGMFFSSNHYEFGEQFGQSLFIMDFPAAMSDRFLQQLTDVSFNIRFTLTTQPLLMNEGIKLINKSIFGMQTDKQKQEKSNMKAGYSPDMINHNLKDSLDDALQLRESIQNQNQKLFLTSCIIVHTAKTLEELKSQKETLQGICSQFICQLRVLSNQQERGLKQSLPFGHNVLDISTTTTTESTAVFIPFISQELNNPDGFVYGQNDISKNLIVLNRKKLQNSGGFYLGSSGSGKSMQAKFEMANVLLKTNDDVIVIDPDGEYAPFAKMFNGECIEISVNSRNHINPLDLDRDYLAGKGNPILAKTDFIISVLETAIGDPLLGLTSGEKAIIEECTKIAYKDLIVHDFDPDYTPTFIDFQEILNELSMESANASRISEAFIRISSGTLSTFSHTTNVDINKRFAVYDISDLGGTGSQLNAMGLLIMLDAVWQRVIKNKRRGVRTWVYCDEFTVLLTLESSADFFINVFKRIRKLDGCPTGITQNITSLYANLKATEMIANAEFLCLLNQSPTDRIQLQEIVGLSDTELEYVSNAEIGSGLIKAGRYIIPYKNKIPKDTELYRAMTTDPDERKEIDGLRRRK